MSEYREFSPKTIMVATDFSGTSYGAIHYAKHLARFFSAKVLLAHVVDETRYLPLPKQTVSTLAEQINAAEEDLEKIYAGLHHDAIPCAMIVRPGSIRDVLTGLVKERNVDLLVIGTRGQGYKNGEGLGSVAEMLLHSMLCPVLTVGTYVRQDACENTHPHSVLFPTDFSPVSRVALAYAEDLTSHLAGHMLLLHVDEEQRPGHESEFHNFVKGMKNPSLVAEYITRTGRPAETIVGVSSEKHADFIVMGVHGANHEDGIAFDVIRSARCPVFTLFIQLPEEMTEAEEFHRQQGRLAVHHG